MGALPGQQEWSVTSGSCQGRPSVFESEPETGFETELDLEVEEGREDVQQPVAS